jgi:hypothetical protein
MALISSAIAVPVSPRPLDRASGDIKRKGTAEPPACEYNSVGSVVDITITAIKAILIDDFIKLILQKLYSLYFLLSF